MKQIDLLNTHRVVYTFVPWFATDEDGKLIHVDTGVFAVPGRGKTTKPKILKFAAREGYFVKEKEYVSRQY